MKVIFRRVLRNFISFQISKFILQNFILHFWDFNGGTSKKEDLQMAVLKENDILFAILTYVLNTLWKRQLISSFSKALLSNLELSEEKWFLSFAYYNDLCTGCSIKKQLITSFGEQFKKNHENLKQIIFQSHVSDSDQRKYSKFFLIAIMV